MASLERKLIMLSAEYGRYPYQDDTGLGFASRGGVPENVYPTVEEAIAAEAQTIREIMVLEQNEIRTLEQSIHARLSHLGILEQ